MLLCVGYLDASLSQHRPAANKTEHVQITGLHTEKGGISVSWLWSNKGTLHRDSSCLSCKRHSMDAEDILQLQVASTQVHISHPLGTHGIADQGNSNSTLQQGTHSN